MYAFYKNLCLVLLCLFSLSSCSTDSELTEAQSELKIVNLVDHIAYSQIELDILSAINDHRISKGLNSLSRVDEITFLALEHNNYMIETKKVNHDNFQKRYAALVKEIGAKVVSENVGFGYRTAEAVVEAWLKSDGHRNNIEGDFSHFGISVEQDEEGKNYFTHIFVKR